MTFLAPIRSVVTKPLWLLAAMMSKLGPFIKFEVVKTDNGKKLFKCLFCQRSLASKQNILKHLESAHDQSK